MLDNHSPGFNNLKDILFLFLLHQIISSLTRITCNSASLLDVIIFSSSITIVGVGVDDLMHCSDHLTVYANLSLARPCRRLTYFGRNLNIIPDAFLACELATVDWSRIYDASHLDDKIYIFMISILYVCSICSINGETLQ